MENQNFQFEEIKKELDDIEVNQEQNSSVQIQSDLNNHSQNGNAITTISLENKLNKEAIFVPESKFLSEEFFYEANRKDAEEFLTNLLTNAFNNVELNLIVINCSFFKKESAYRKIVHSLVEKKFPNLGSYSAGGKDYLIISRKNEFFESLQKMKREDLQIVLDSIFIKMESEEMVKKQEDADVNDFMSMIKEEIEKGEPEKIYKPFLPIIPKCEIYDIRSSSATLRLPVIEKEDIIVKNRNRIIGFRTMYKDTSVFYQVLLYEPDSIDLEDDKFNQKFVSIENTIKLTDLKPNTGYLVKICVKYDKYYSKPSKSFIFFTRNEEAGVYNSFYTWGNNFQKHLLVDENNYDSEDFKRLHPNVLLMNNFIESSINNANDSKEEPDLIMYPTRLKKNNVVNFSESCDSTYLLLSNGELISSGKIYVKKLPENLSEEALAKADVSKLVEFEQAPIDEVQVIYDSYFSMNLPWGAKFRKISCGLDFCAALSFDGEVFTWGMNDFGQLGQNICKELVINVPKKINILYDNQEMFITDIQTGSKHCLALGFCNEKMKLFSWGFGQGAEPILKEDEKSLFNFDKKLSKITNASSPLLLKFSEVDNICKIYAAFNQNAIICLDKSTDMNHVYTFGEVNNCQLGFEHSFLQGQYYWGFPTLVTHLRDNQLSVLDISFGEEHSVFLVYNSIAYKNEIYTCGFNSHFQTGNKEKYSLLPQKVELNDSISPIKISAGKKHTLFLSSEKKLYLIGKSLIQNKKMNNKLINEIKEISLKSDQEIIKMSCFNDNVKLLIENKN